MNRSWRIGVVIPARDECESIYEVVSSLRALKQGNAPMIEHIVVCDNGSRDNSAALAKDAGATVVYEPQAGYGRACLAAVAAMPEVDILVFVDGDRSIYPEQLRRLVLAIQDGAALAIGARTLGNIEPGAMTLTQRFGNRFALALVRLLWGFQFKDLGPFRAIRWEAYRNLQMRDEAFGWTMEMQLKAVQHQLRIVEIPVDTRARLGHSKISGTVRGVIGAAHGILGMVVTLWKRERALRRAATALAAKSVVKPAV